MTPELWLQHNNIYNTVQQMKVIDVNGKPMQAQSNGGGGGGDYYEVNVDLRPAGAMFNNNDDAKAAAPPKPASLTWDTTGETEEVKLPLQAADLIVP